MRIVAHLQARASREMMGELTLAVLKFRWKRYDLHSACIVSRKRILKKPNAEHNSAHSTRSTIHVDFLHQNMEQKYVCI